MKKKMGMAPRDLWWQQRQTGFWLRSALLDGEEFLRSCDAVRAFEPPGSEAIGEFMDRWRQLVDRLELSKYHFVTTLGSLLRQLDQAQRLFPDIVPACQAAEHLMKEGRDLRNMIEHADEYLAGKGKKQKDFVREIESSDFPGSVYAVSDATSLIVDKSGHLIGGRLNTEQTLAEIRAILTAFNEIPEIDTTSISSGS